jgi:VWFA-related protein
VTARVAAVAVVVAAAWTAVATGQQSTFHSETRLVVLRATVKNNRGVEVSGLDRDAFTVFENGKRQPITLFRHDDVPVSIGLLIDNSGSMRSLRARVEAAALAFVRASNPLDETFVVNFADRVHVDVPMTGDVHTLEAGIARADSIGGTAMRDAVDAGERYLKEHATHDRHVLLVVTDGRDNASTVTLKQIEDLSRRTDTAVYAIGFFRAEDSSEAKDGRHELDALTRETGGVAAYPRSVDDITSAATDLARQIRSQYTIAYAPTNQALDGTYRQIRVEARGREPLTVKTRPGYIAAASADRSRR